MKILFINNFRKRGGGEEFLRDLLPGLVEKGITVGLVCRPGTPLADMFRNSEIAIFPIQRSLLGSVSTVWKTARVIREGGYEFVDIQRGHDIIQAWLAALLSGKKPLLLYTLQVPEFVKSRFLLSRMAQIVTISRYIRDKLVAFSPTVASRTSIIHYGIELDRFRRGTTLRGSLRNRFRLSPETKIIGAVGDIWKNQIEFLDALVLIRQEVTNACFVLAAVENSSVQVEAFKRRVEQLGLTDAVLWAGRLSKEDMPSFYADIDVAITTYRNEGFGIWVLEALAAGTPVVSVNAGGVRDSLEGCPAAVLVDGGPKDMAAEVVKIFKDPSLRTIMADSGPRWIAERFSRNRMVDDYFHFFQSLQGNGRAPGDSKREALSSLRE